MVGGELFRCGMVCDVMTAARLRGKGVFTKLGAYSLDQLERAGVDFVSGYPRRPEVIPGHLKVGWNIAFKLPMYLAPLRTGALLRSRLPRLGLVAPLADRALGVARLAQRAVLPNPRDLVTRVWPWRLFLDTFDVDAFGERWRATVKNALVKSREFMRWRLSIQETDYTVVTAQREGELIGFSIVRPCVPEGVPALALLDVMWLGSPSEVIADLDKPAVLVPAFLASGYHVRKDIPEHVALAGRPDTVVTRALGPDPAIAAVARLRLAEAGWEPGDSVVLAAAGSSDPSACSQVYLAARQLESLIGGRVEVGFITTAQPSVPEAIEKARRTGRRVVVASYLLAPGLFHQRLETYGADAVAAPLGPDPRIVDLIVTRMRAAISPYRRTPVPRLV